MKSNTWFAACTLALILSLAFTSTATASLGACNGCVDSTAAPPNPPTDEHWWGPDFRGSAEWHIEITPDSGVCELVEKEIHGGGTAWFCDDTTPCTPTVTTWVVLEGDILGATEWWDVSASGSYGPDSQDNYSTTVSNDTTLTLFNGPVRVGCGREVSSNVTYSVKFYLKDIFGNPETEANWSADFHFDFECSACNLGGGS